MGNAVSAAATAKAGMKANELMDTVDKGFDDLTNRVSKQMGNVPKENEPPKNWRERQRRQSDRARV